MSEQITKVELEDRIKSSYLAYSISVIADRALPDYRDGLKPVARRILYSMYKMGLRKNTPHRKCARIVGDVLGKFHPHGDQAVYGALVRLAQDFIMNCPLIDGQGSFGSIDDDPAAMRYTEARLEKISEFLLDELEFGTVDFIDNFDSSTQEPKILPARFPNLIVNGTSGIAVGMKTDIPPHNLGEMIDALILLIDEPNSSLDDILRIVKGPDFPTGGTVIFETPKKEIYETGVGNIILRAKIEDLEVKRRNGIQITELPYQISKEKILQQIIKLIKEKILEGVLDLRDESDRNGINIVLEFSRKIDHDEIVKILYARTKLESSVKMNFLALDNNNPKLFTLKQYLEMFINFRIDIIKRYLNFKLIEKKARKNILEGYKKIINDIDHVIKIIRKAESNIEIKEHLTRRYSMNEEQTQSILDMKLSKLSKLEENNIDKEIKLLVAEIAETEAILESKKKLKNYLKDDLLAIKENFSKKRLSKIIN